MRRELKFEMHIGSFFLLFLLLLFTFAVAETPKWEICAATRHHPSGSYI